MAIKLKTWDLSDAVLTGSIFLRSAQGDQPDRLNYTPLGPYYAAVVADGATGYWRLDEGEGTSARNEIGGGSAGAATSPIWTGGEGPHTGSFRKTYSSRFEADIDHKYIVPFHTGVDLQDSISWSIEFWFNKNLGTGAQGTVIHQGPVAADGVLIRYRPASDRWEFLLQSTTSTLQTRKYFDTPRVYDEDPDVWEHYVAVYNPSVGGPGDVDSMTFAINGSFATESASLNGLGGDSFENSSDFAIGGQTTTAETMQGHLSDVAVYRGVALSPAQVADHYSKISATGSETADATFSYTLPALDFPYGGEVKMVQLPGSLGRYESGGGGQYHTRVFLSLDGGDEIEVNPNEALSSGLQINAGGTIDVIARFSSDATFESGLGPNVHELGDGTGPSVLIDNQLSASEASGIQWRVPPLGPADRFVRSDRR